MPGSMETQVSLWLDFVPMEMKGQTPNVSNIAKSGLSTSFELDAFIIEDKMNSQ